MYGVATSLRRLPLLIFALVILSVAAFGQSDSGSINLQGTASGYVEVVTTSPEAAATNAD